MKEVLSSFAPTPVGPYSQAVLSGNILFISGQIPFDMKANALVENDICKATECVMNNIGLILKEAGMNYSNVVKTSIFLTDMSLFSEVNKIYSSYLTKPFPARETMQVSALPMKSMIEISAIAVK